MTPHSAETLFEPGTEASKGNETFRIRNKKHAINSAIAHHPRYVFVTLTLDRVFPALVGPRYPGSDAASKFGHAAMTVADVVQQNDLCALPSSISLCERCQSFDWTWGLGLFERQMQTGYQERRIVTTFASATALVHDTRCPFCCALRMLGKDSAICPSGAFHLVASPTAERYFRMASQILVIRQGISSRDEFPSAFYTSRSDIPYRGLAGKILEEESSSNPRHWFNRNKIDFPLLAQWLQDCELSHDQCPGKEPNLTGLRLIDCTSGAIVEQPPNTARYAALSYVWGVGNVGEINAVKTEGVIRDLGTVGLTIADAMVVTTRLGLDYLWVDRYCIPDDDKARQISLMNEIYRNATITIVAAAGVNPMYGLPGVSTRGQMPHVSGHIGPNRFFTLGRMQRTQLETSKWASRGWTYQEGVLAPRKLIFADEVVSWQCVTKFESDGLLEPDQLFQLAGSSWPHISEFVKRELTNKEDYLDALTGVLNEAQCKDPDHVRHLEGLPISALPGESSTTTWKSALLKSLFPWAARGLSRRPGFPSWSWTGWQCEPDGSFRGFEVYHHSYKLKDLGNLLEESYTRQIQLGFQSGLVDAEEYIQRSTNATGQQLQRVKFIELTVKTFSGVLRAQTQEGDWVLKLYHIDEDGAEHLLIGNIELAYLGIPFPKADQYLCKGLLLDLHQFSRSVENIPAALVLLTRWVSGRGCHERLLHQAFELSKHDQVDAINTKLETVRLGY